MAGHGPYRTFIRNTYSDLCHDLRCAEIVLILYQERYITEHEKELVKTHKTSHQRNEQLLDLLRGEDACKCFYEALETTCQEYLQNGFVDIGKYHPTV